MSPNACAAFFASLVLGACASVPPPPAKPSLQPYGNPEFYAIVTEDGRDYVFGTSANYRRYLVTKDAEFTQSVTRVGDGPGGRTVILEASATDPDMQERLKAKYFDGLYYAEETRDGRLHVFGRKETHEAWKQGGEVPYTLTFVGGGPQGQTVVVEALAKNWSLQERLRGEFVKRHGKAL